MYFKIGYTVRPKEVNNLSQVIYEEYYGDGGLQDVLPTSDECTGYGFVFNDIDTRCYIVTNPLTFTTPNPLSNLSIARGSNFIGTNTRDNVISGINHILYGNNYSNIISGDNHSLENLVSNSSISGSKGIATVDNSVVIGGNAVADRIGERQSIQLMYGIQTLNGTNTVSFLNNTTDSLFAIPENSVMYFHADIIAVRVGGVHGTGAVGDYGSWVERGVIINKSGVLSINRERDTIKSSGTVTNWQPTGIVSGTDFAMRVRGHTDMTIEWCSNITFTEIKTGVSL
tara:strand:- start:1759 stop:2613 length:855 start_codon:yes stop_codon:yes gene_type:complete